MSAAAPMPARRTVVDFEGVFKIYGQGDTEVHALDGVDMRIEDGEFVAIMGPSGSGKSTAMNIIGCLDAPSRGSYRFRGVDVGALTRDQRALLRRHYIGFVFQGYNLLARTSGARERRAAAGLPARAAGERRRARRCDALECRGPLGSRRHTPARALRRSAAARGHRAGARHPALAPARRRAHRQPRLALARTEIMELLVRAQPRARHHHRHGHPRAGHGASTCPA